MNDAMHLSLTVGDWFDLFSHFLTLSLLAVGGAITTVADMHRYLVDQQHWLNEAQFNASIAIAQAAPGPNVLFVALMGWNVGINAGGILLGLLGVVVSMAGILIPSTMLTYLAARWGHENRERLAVKAFRQGLAPIVVALMLATSWILASSYRGTGHDLTLWALILLATLVVWRTKVHLLWLLALGAFLGWFGLV